MSVLTTFYRFLLRGGPTEKASIEVAKDRELLLDTTTKELRVGDGATPGGLPLTVGTPTADRHIANKAYVDTGLAFRALSVHQHARADLPWVTDPGAALLTAESASAQRTALGLTAWAVAPWTDGTTSDIPEGTQLYFTNARADARIAAQKGQADGLAPLDAGGKVPSANLPDSIAQADDAAKLGAQLPAYYLTRTNHTGTQPASSISDFAATTRSTVATGMVTTTPEVALTTDTLLAIIGKLQAQATQARKEVYQSETGGVNCVIPLAATGDGSGVLTLRLWSDIASTARLSAGAFYGELAGTTNLGASVTLAAGAYTTFYLKVPSGAATLTISSGWALTRWGARDENCIVEATNAPKLDGFDLKYIPRCATIININANLGHSVVMGNVKPWESITYLLLGGDAMTLGGTAGQWYDADTVIFGGGLMTLTVDLSASCLTAKNLSLFLYGAGITVTYPASRPWPETMRQVTLRTAVGSMVQADGDRFWADVDAFCATATLEKILDLRGNCAAPSSASAPFRTSLAAKGFAVSHN